MIGLKIRERKSLIEWKTRVHPLTEKQTENYALNTQINLF